MHNLTCKKCGETANSKCPSERSVFTTDQEAAVLSYLIKFPKTERVTEDGLYEINLQIRYNPTLDTVEGAEFEALRMISMIKEETIRHLVCSHHWVGTCDFGHNHK